MVADQEAKQMMAINQAVIRILAYVAKVQGTNGKKESNEVDIGECILEEEQETSQDIEIWLDDLVLALIKMDDVMADVQDLLKEVNLGTKQVRQPVYISGLLDLASKAEVVKLLSEFSNCFAWSYEEMLRLDSKLVEHKLPIKDGFRRFKQPPQRMSQEVTDRINEEIKKLLQAGFIYPIRYVKWLSNIVPVMKKNYKIKVCIDSYNLNMVHRRTSILC